MHYLPSHTRTLTLLATTLTLTLSLVSCTVDNHLTAIATPPAPEAGAITAIAVNPYMVTGATLAISNQSGDSIQAVATSTGDSISTPWRPSSSYFDLLGMLPATTYSIHILSRRSGIVARSIDTTYTTPPLPSDVATMTMTVTGRLSSDYSALQMFSASGMGYAVIFDSLGRLRWYRPVSRHMGSYIALQKSGLLTVDVGQSTGNNGVDMYFLDLTPSGDSVKAVRTLGSHYTDPHDLLETDVAGHHQDYLFGYDLRAQDRTAMGGGLADIAANHEIVRITDATKVDTLINGWTTWVSADEVESPTAMADTDHPNSIVPSIDGNFIVSYRNMGAILKISPSGQKIWQLGGRQNQFTITDPLGKCSAQHNVTELPNGNLLIYDNGWAHSPQKSRVVEYKIDPIAKTATMVWSYTPSAGYFNDFTGSAQRLANGNTVVGWTHYGVVEEVSPDATLLGQALFATSGVPDIPSYRFLRLKSLYSYQAP